MIISTALFCFATATTSPWPLITVRHTAAINSQPQTFARLMAEHKKYPGAVDEFWFATQKRQKTQELERACRAIASFRTACAETGVRFGYQQGLTLGHSSAHDGPLKEDERQFPEDAFQVGPDGRRNAYLCPRAPEVLKWEYEHARIILSVLKPESFWVDDDLRLGVSHVDGCFCPRCLAAFNAETGEQWTRETLAKALFSDGKTVSVRRRWIEFNADSLALFASEVRKAADETGSDCRLGYQAVWSDRLITGRDFRKTLEALSGKACHAVGIRPGAGFYTEAEPRGMIFKCLSVAREAERCRALGSRVGTVCYEEENYPRRVLHKSPGAIITECALAMASGCDTISLYWYSASTPEPIDEYGRFLGSIAAARSYFKRLSEHVRRTRLAGVARYVGSCAGEQPDFDLRDSADMMLACAGVPVTVAESGTHTWYLTAKSILEMRASDLNVLREGGVVAPKSLLSELSGDFRLAQIAVVPEYVQYPFAPDRSRLLDVLDRVTPDGLCVRVDECRPLRILPRILADGRVDTVTLLNVSIGATDVINVRIRHPSGSRVEWCRPGKPPVGLSVRSGTTTDEIVVLVPDIGGWEIGTLYFE